MAWNNVTYKCGCTHREQLYGSYDSRDAHIARCAEKLCPECMKKQQNEQSASFAKKNNLIELQGSEKHIAWANTIRMRACNIKTNEIRPKISNNIEVFDELIKTHIMGQEQAKWWIDNRSELDSMDSIMMYLQTQIK